MTVPSDQGPDFDLLIGETMEFEIKCYEADTTTELVVQAADVFRFKVWKTDGSAPDIDADSVALLSDTFTTAFGTDLFTSTSAHGLVVGDAIHISTSASDQPAPLLLETAYWVITVDSTTTFTVSTTKGGAGRGSSGGMKESGSMSNCSLQ